MYITNSYVLDGHLIERPSVQIQTQVKSQVCEIGSGGFESSRKLILTATVNEMFSITDMTEELHGMNSMSSWWSSFIHCNVTENEKVGLCEVKSFWLAPSYSRSPSGAELLTLGLTVKELTADMTFPFHSFPVRHSRARRPPFFLESSKVSQNIH